MKRYAFLAGVAKSICTKFKVLKSGKISEKNSLPWFSCNLKSEDLKVWQKRKEVKLARPEITNRIKSTTPPRYN